MIRVKQYLIQGFLELVVAAQVHLTGRHWKSGSQRSHMEFQDGVAAQRKPRTGTFITTSKPELRTSCDISQWTDWYWIGGLSRAPTGHFTLAISTR